MLNIFKGNDSCFLSFCCFGGFYELIVFWFGPRYSSWTTSPLHIYIIERERQTDGQKERERGRFLLICDANDNNLQFTCFKMFSSRYCYWGDFACLLVFDGNTTHNSWYSSKASLKWNKLFYFYFCNYLRGGSGG